MMRETSMIAMTSFRIVEMRGEWGRLGDNWNRLGFCTSIDATVGCI